MADTDKVSAITAGRLRRSWPLASIASAFLIGLAADGIGGGVLAATFGTLVVGPAYLIQNQIRRRRGTLRSPRAKAAEQAKSDSLLLRAGAIIDAVLAVAALVLAVGDRGELLPGSNWTAGLLIVAAIGASSAPYVWGLAEWSPNQRSPRWPWALAGLLDLVFGLTAAVLAIVNSLTHPIGGLGWTIGLAVLALMWLLGAPGNLLRARA